jgi:hypothetical protein
VHETRQHPLAHLLDTLTIPAHRRAFALIALLMVGACAVIPFISTSFVAGGAGEPLRNFGTVGMLAAGASCRRAVTG